MSSTVPAAGTTTTITVGNLTDQPATWKDMDTLTEGDLIVRGPATGSTWMAENKVEAVRRIDVIGDRTNTCITTSRNPATDGSDPDISGQWSRMRFLTLDGPIPC